MFPIRVRTCVFENLNLKETCFHYFAEAFKNKNCRYDCKSFELAHFLKNVSEHESDKALKNNVQAETYSLNHI